MSKPLSAPGRVRPPLHGLAAALGQTLGRSLFPLVALFLLGATLLWGPWVSLALAVLWWKVVTRIG